MRRKATDTGRLTQAEQMLEAAVHDGVQVFGVQGEDAHADVFEDALEDALEAVPGLPRRESRGTIDTGASRESKVPVARRRTRWSADAAASKGAGGDVGGWKVDCPVDPLDPAVTVASDPQPQSRARMFLQIRRELSEHIVIETNLPKAPLPCFG